MHSLEKRYQAKTLIEQFCTNYPPHQIECDVGDPPDSVRRPTCVSVSDVTGLFVFSSLPPGRYQLVRECVCVCVCGLSDYLQVGGGG